ncbi:MAG: endonuclease domain-containing protein [bacterium]
MNRKFGRWTVTRFNSERTINGHKLVDCRCDCGTVRSIDLSTLLNGHSQSCGCTRLKYPKKCAKFLTLIRCNYGLISKDWTRLVLQSNGKCEIYSKQFKNARNVCIDHDHQTNKIRGLLCESCNFGLGFFRTPDLYSAAIKYLVKTEK